MTRIHAPLAIAIGLACLWLPSCGSPGTPPTPPNTAPRVTAISPVTGSTLGGTAVTITGANFAEGATVTIGGAAARDVVVSGTTAITATTAAHVAGAVDVVVSVGVQSGRLAGAFTYVVPPVTNNQPPEITALEAQGTREDQPPRFADLDEEINVSASVADVETAPEKLEYQWSAPGGTFSGTGARVKWRAPDLFVTPAVMSLTLTVVETYTVADASGLPVTLQNKTSRSVDVNLHDSEREIAAMARRFLIEFSQPQTNKDWRDIMRDFDLEGTRCREPGTVIDEREQVIRHYTNFFMHSYDVGTAAVDVAFGGTCAFRRRLGDACAAVPVSWDSTDRSKSPPVRKATSGTDHLSAVYSRQEARWWLCSSDYEAVDATWHPFYSARP